MKIDKYYHLYSKKDEIVFEEVPEQNYCKDCRKHNRDFGYKEEICPLVRFRGKAQGHEFDYQYCVYFERRER